MFYILLIKFSFCCDLVCEGETLEGVEASVLVMPAAVYSCELNEQEDREVKVFLGYTCIPGQSGLLGSLS